MGAALPAVQTTSPKTRAKLSSTGTEATQIRSHGPTRNGVFPNIWNGKPKCMER